MPVTLDFPIISFLLNRESYQLSCHTSSNPLCGLHGRDRRKGTAAHVAHQDERGAGREEEATGAIHHHDVLESYMYSRAGVHTKASPGVAVRVRP